MEKENLLPEMDDFDREERCIRTIKNVTKAIVMRCILTVILLMVLVGKNLPVWVWILLIFVVAINVFGAVPLFKEWKKRYLELREIRASEE